METKRKAVDVMPDVLAVSVGSKPTLTKKAAGTKTTTTV